jgi:hypothetical protein
MLQYLLFHMVAVDLKKNVVALALNQVSWWSVNAVLSGDVLF